MRIIQRDYYCEYCNQNHDGTYGTGRFCSARCARGFSTKTKRKKINKKVSKKLKTRADKYCQCGQKLSWNNRSGYCMKCRQKLIPAAGVKTNVSNFRRRRKIKLIKAKGRYCEKCNYDGLRCPPVMVFHHPDPEKKDRSLMKILLTVSYERALQEVKCCQLLCCRCHREMHYGINKT